MDPFIQRMVGDMQLRNLADATIDAYTYYVDKFCHYFGKPADQLGPEEIRQYQLYLVNEKKVTPMHRESQTPSSDPDQLRGRPAAAGNHSPARGRHRRDAGTNPHLLRKREQRKRQTRHPCRSVPGPPRLLSELREYWKLTRPRNYLSLARHRTSRVSQQVKSVLAKILLCRTPTLRGRIYECRECHSRCNVYNSCTDRHCPLCRGVRRATWLDKPRALLLPGVVYFQVVFTLPDKLAPLILGNRKVLYDLLFRSAWRSGSRWHPVGSGSASDRTQPRKTVPY
jgi:hypothetical protein